MSGGNYLWDICLRAIIWVQSSRGQFSTQAIVQGVIFFGGNFLGVIIHSGVGNFPVDNYLGGGGGNFPETLSRNPKHYHLLLNSVSVGCFSPIIPQFFNWRGRTYTFIMHSSFSCLSNIRKNSMLKAYRTRNKFATLLVVYCRK